jgi:hypothetical protein
VALISANEVWTQQVTLLERHEQQRVDLMELAAV